MALHALGRMGGDTGYFADPDGFRGGDTGYFADPDGFRWEVAYNPGPIGLSVL